MVIGPTSQWLVRRTNGEGRARKLLGLFVQCFTVCLPGTRLSTVVLACDVSPASAASRRPWNECRMDHAELVARVEERRRPSSERSNESPGPFEVSPCPFGNV